MTETQQCFLPRELEAPGGLRPPLHFLPWHRPSRAGFVSSTEASESGFIFTSEAFYFLCVCSLGSFRGDIVNGTCRGRWHPNPRMLWKGICGTLGRTGSWGPPHPPQPAFLSPAPGHHQEGREPSNTLCTLSPLAHPEGDKVPKQTQTKPDLHPCRADGWVFPWWGSRQLLGVSAAQIRAQGAPDKPQQP